MPRLLPQSWLQGVRRHTVEAMSRYWRDNGERILELPMPCSHTAEEHCSPPAMTRVGLPKWACDVGVEGTLLVPSSCVLSGAGPAWLRTDWLAAGHWYLNGLAEKAYEAQHGPIHSYAFRLRGWAQELWEHAWVNRVAMFLRRWSARQAGASENVLHGPLPEPEIVVTHDLDAIRKTSAIRFKQGAFGMFNALRHLVHLRPVAFLQKATQALRFAFRRGDYWQFDAIRQLESQAGIRSVFFVYGGEVGPGRNLRSRLFDPAYDVADSLVRERLLRMHGEGWGIGLHPSFDSWRSPERLHRERHKVEQSLGLRITACRQHWLRFSWHHTWRSQQEAGLALDCTLAFNDRPGFRSGAALRYRPWDCDSSRPMDIEVMPMVLMDSQVFDYAEYEPEQRARQIHGWLDEIRAVRGVATVNWHPHVLSPDYGWRAGYECCLSALNGSVRRSAAAAA